MLEKDKSLLSYDEQNIITELVDRHQITQKNTRVLIKYYVHFVKTLNIQNPSPSLRKNFAEIALIFTEKSNFYKTLDNQQCPGICFSMNDILKSKSYAQINTLVSLSKKILETVKFKQMSLKTETYKLMTEIQEGLQEAMMFERLCWVFFKNTLDNSPEIQSYKEKLINFSWYLYIDVKNNYCIQNHSSVGISKLLMVSVLETIILNSLSHIIPLILQKNSPKRYSLNISQQKKQMMSLILDILLKQAQINPSQLMQYQQINQSFNHYFDTLISTGIIKSFSEERFDFLCQRSLDANFRKIDRKISKQILSNQFDLRKLISYELNVEKDHKKTAIQDKMIIKHKKSSKTKPPNPQPNKKYKSHRVLDLDNCQIELSSSSVLTESQITFPPNVILDNRMRMSVPGLNFRTEKDQLKKFLMHKTRPYMADLNQYQTSILTYIQNSLKQIIISQQGSSFHQNRKSLLQHQQSRSQNILHAYEFYLYLTSQAWHSVQEHYTQYILEQNDSTHECLLIISMGVILLSQYQDQSSSEPFVRLLSCLKPDMMDFFYAVIYLKQFDLPKKMIKSLDMVIENLINEQLWTESSFIEEINSTVENFSEIDHENSETLAISCILQKVSQYISQKVNFIKSHLTKQSSPSYNINNQIQIWSRKSIQLVLSFIIYCLQIMHQRLLDQLILCCMYGVSKYQKMAIRFHELIQVYNKSIQCDQIQFERTILNVKSSFTQSETDIIGFYNNEFIKYLNDAFEIIGDKQKMKIVFQLCGDLQSQEMLTSPFTLSQQAIILSPKLHKSKSQTYGLKQIQRTINKQNSEQNASHSININLDHQGQLGIVSFVSEDYSQSFDESQNSGKICINLEINQTSSRNPTRVKERKSNQQKQNQLCATHKGKHPIFTQFKKIDEE